MDSAHFLMLSDKSQYSYDGSLPVFDVVSRVLNNELDLGSLKHVLYSGPNAAESPIVSKIHFQQLSIICGMSVQSFCVHFIRMRSDQVMIPCLKELSLR